MADSHASPMLTALVGELSQNKFSGLTGFFP